MPHQYLGICCKSGGIPMNRVDLCQPFFRSDSEQVDAVSASQCQIQYDIWYYPNHIIHALVLRDAKQARNIKIGFSFLIHGIHVLTSGTVLALDYLLFLILRLLYSPSLPISPLSTLGNVIIYNLVYCSVDACLVGLPWF